MKTIYFVFINSLSKEEIKTVEDILRNERLKKYLWVEFILNPQIVKISELYMGNTIVKDSLVDGLSWYFAFKWLLPKNEPLEELYQKKIILPYRVKDDIYRQKRSSFLKGILHAQLC